MASCSYNSPMCKPLTDDGFTCRAMYPSLDSHVIKDKFACNSDKDVTDPISSTNGCLIRQASSSSESDWREPSLQLCDPKVLQTYGSNKVYDAFHLMRTDSSIQVLCSL